MLKSLVSKWNAGTLRSNRNVLTYSLVVMAAFFAFSGSMAFAQQSNELPTEEIDPKSDPNCPPLTGASDSSEAGLPAEQQRSSSFKQLNRETTAVALVAESEKRLRQISPEVDAAKTKRQPSSTRQSKRRLQ